MLQEVKHALAYEGELADEPLGMAGFGFAVMIDGIIRIFSGTQTEKEL